MSPDRVEEVRREYRKVCPGHLAQTASTGGPSASWAKTGPTPRAPPSAAAGGWLPTGAASGGEEDGGQPGAAGGPGPGGVPAVSNSHGVADMVAEGVVGGYFRPRSERLHAPDALDRSAPGDVLKRRRTNIREKPPVFWGGREREQQALEGTGMVSNVHQVHFLDTQLPEGDSEKARFAREYVANLVGAESAGEVTFFMQPSNLDPSCRITISVPRRMAEAVRSIEEIGLQPVFRELEAPHVDGNSCVAPGSFQVRYFGMTIDPRSVSDHPQRQGSIADTWFSTSPTCPRRPGTSSTGPGPMPTRRRAPSQFTGEEMRAWRTVHPDLPDPGPRNGLQYWNRSREIAGRAKGTAPVPGRNAKRRT